MVFHCFLDRGLIPIIKFGIQMETKLKDDVARINPLYTVNVIMYPTLFPPQLQNITFPAKSLSPFSFAFAATPPRSALPLHFSMPRKRTSPYSPDEEFSPPPSPPSRLKRRRRSTRSSTICIPESPEPSDVEPSDVEQPSPKVQIIHIDDGSKHSRDSAPSELEHSRDAVPSELDDSRDSVPAGPDHSRDAMPSEPDNSRDAVPSESENSRDAPPSEQHHSRERSTSEPGQTNQVPTSPPPLIPESDPESIPPPDNQDDSDYHSLSDEPEDSDSDLDFAPKSKHKKPVAKQKSARKPNKKTPTRGPRKRASVQPVEQKVKQVRAQASVKRGHLGARLRPGLLKANVSTLRKLGSASKANSSKITHATVYRSGLSRKADIPRLHSYLK